MKKFLIPLLLFINVILLTGCGTKQSTNTMEEPQTVVEEIQEETITPQEEQVTEEEKIVEEPSNNDDRANAKNNSENTK